MFPALHRLWSATLDLLLPQKPLVRELLAMSPADFRERAETAEGGAGSNALALFDYRNPVVKEAVWMLKYRGNRRIAALLGELLYEDLLAFLLEYAPLANITELMLVPIPLSRKRERERGFNQCELLVDCLARQDKGRNFAVSKAALRKIKETPSQTKTDNRKKRLENLSDCFQADAELVAGRNIILIDDVATTGATLEEARKTLLAAGARKVIAFTIAH